MGIIQTIVFLVFVLPVLMVKDLWARFTKNMTPKEKKKMLWRMPYFLIAMLVVLLLILWSYGYR